VGAYAGIVVGTFLILTVAPAKALLFIIFIIVLQQIENNLIYPKVVGSSIGLPGIWVLAAITIGGGIGGVAGMVLGVPVAATVYKLLRAEVRIRMENKQTGSKEKK
jgi:predicted PurR-regulated permease PerM